MAAFKSVNLPRKDSDPDFIHKIVSWNQADVDKYLIEVFIFFMYKKCFVFYKFLFCQYTNTVVIFHVYRMEYLGVDLYWQQTLSMEKPFWV